MKKVVDTILNFFFPTKCIVCNAIGADICARCVASFEPPKAANYDWIVSCWNYRDGNVERVMRHIKNNPNKRAAKICAEKIFSELKKYNHSMNENKKLQNVILVPIPIGRARFRKRGYNHSLLLAHPIATMIAANLA